MSRSFSVAVSAALLFAVAEGAALTSSGRQSLLAQHKQSSLWNEPSQCSEPWHRWDRSKHDATDLYSTGLRSDFSHPSSTTLVAASTLNAAVVYPGCEEHEPKFVAATVLWQSTPNQHDLGSASPTGYQKPGPTQYWLHLQSNRLGDVMVPMDVAVPVVRSMAVDGTGLVVVGRTGELQVLIRAKRSAASAPQGFVCCCTRAVCPPVDIAVSVVHADRSCCKRVRSDTCNNEHEQQFSEIDASQQSCEGVRVVDKTGAPRPALYGDVELGLQQFYDSMEESREQIFGSDASLVTRVLFRADLWARSGADTIWKAVSVNLVEMGDTRVFYVGTMRCDWNRHTLRYYGDYLTAVCDGDVTVWLGLVPEMDAAKCCCKHSACEGNGVQWEWSANRKNGGAAKVGSICCKAHNKCGGMHTGYKHVAGEKDKHQLVEMDDPQGESVAYCFPSEQHVAVGQTQLGVLFGKLSEA